MRFELENGVALDVADIRFLKDEKSIVASERDGMKYWLNPQLEGKGASHFGFRGTLCPACGREMYFASRCEAVSSKDAKELEKALRREPRFRLKMALFGKEGRRYENQSP